MKIEELQNKIAEAILAKIEEDGTLIWRSNFFDNAMKARNVSSGRPYKGFVNALIIAVDMAEKGYDLPYFIGFKQCEAYGWKVRKGSKGTALFAVNTAFKEEVNEQGEIEKSLKNYFGVKHVFNIACIDDADAKKKVADVIGKFEVPTYRDNIERNSRIDAVLHDLNVDIRITGVQPCYNMTNDFIAMPKQESFTSDENFYLVLLHEVAHWTGGKPNRVPREMKTANTNKKLYAIEELNAELASTFMAQRFGISADIDNTSAYIKSWSKLLTDKKDEFWKCVSMANKIANFVLPVEEVEETETA